MEHKSKFSLTMEFEVFNVIKGVKHATKVMNGIEYHPGKANVVTDVLSGI